MLDTLIKNAVLLPMTAPGEVIYGANVGIKGLNTLLYGWKRKRRYGLQYLTALKHRNWLYITEVMDFSEYAGCDLTAPGPRGNLKLKFKIKN